MARLTYHIKDVSRFSGMTRQALHYYYKNGILSEKIHSEGYRNFTYRELNKLLIARNYRRMDFSLKKTSQLISGVSKITIMKDFDDQLEVIEKKILVQQNIMKHILRNKVAIDKIDTHYKNYEIVDSPAMYHIQLQTHLEDIDRNKKKNKILDKLFDSVPVIIPSNIMDYSMIKKGFAVGFGFGVLEEDFKDFADVDVESETITYTASKKSLYTIIKVAPNDIDFFDNFRDLVEYINQNSYQPQGIVFGMPIVSSFVEKDTNMLVDYYEVWILLN